MARETLSMERPRDSFSSGGVWLSVLVREREREERPPIMELKDFVNEPEDVRPVISGALREGDAIEGVWGEVTAFQAGSGSGLWKLEISKERRIVPVKEEEESLVDGRDGRGVRLAVGAVGDGLGAGLVSGDSSNSSPMDGARAGRPLLDAGLGMYVAQLRLLDGVSVPLEAIGGKDKKGVGPYLGNLQLGPCIRIDLVEDGGLGRQLTRGLLIVDDVRESVCYSHVNHI